MPHFYNSCWIKALKIFQAEKFTFPTYFDSNHPSLVNYFICTILCALTLKQEIDTTCSELSCTLGRSLRKGTYYFYTGVRLSVSLPVCLSACLSVCPSVCLCVWPSFIATFKILYHIFLIWFKKVRDISEWSHHFIQVNERADVKLVWRNIILNYLLRHTGRRCW